MPTEQRLVLYDIDWPTYRTIADALPERHLRLSYHEGTLELMKKSSAHCHLICVLRCFTWTLAEELHVALGSCGDMTCNREDLLSAIEPDDCYYVTHEAQMRANEHVDLMVDPPPDLAVEVDLTTDSRRRMGIYAAMRVPEVWRFDGKIFEVNQLSESGAYAKGSTSRYFPGIDLSPVAGFLARTDLEENTLVREFRDWVRLARR